jgi:O-acetyl-ADP-ribose deacetylase (regulator of RNase III)
MFFVRTLRATSLALLVFVGTTLTIDELAQKLGHFSESLTQLEKQLHVVPDGPEKNILNYSSNTVSKSSDDLLFSRFQLNVKGKSKTIIIQMGDMLSMPVDAVVDAANTELLPGSGVSGSVKVAYSRYRRATGSPTYPLGQPDQKDWTMLCVYQNGTKVTVGGSGLATGFKSGDACINLGVRCLPNDGDVKKSLALVHAVAPTDEKRMDLVYNAYKNALEAADNLGDFLNKYQFVVTMIAPALEKTFKATPNITKIAFPLLGIGVFGLPIPEVIDAALKAIVEFLKKSQHIDTVYIMIWPEDQNTKMSYTTACNTMQKYLVP